MSEQNQIKPNQCVICDSNSIVFWAKEDKGDNILFCNNCSVRFIENFKTSEENTELYGDEYFESKITGTTETINNEKKLFIRDFKSIEAISRIKDLTPHTKFLDIGTGGGRYLKLLKSLGYDELSGFDVTDLNKIDLMKFNVSLHTGNFSDIPPNHQFDVITAFHVLEHIDTPKEFLANVKELLAPDGVIYFLLPNEGGLTSRIKSFQSKYLFKPKPYKHLSPGHHSIFYNSSVVKRLFTDIGYTVKFCKGTRSSVKRRSIIGKFVQYLLAKFGSNSWLEVVAINKVEFEKKSN